MKSNNGGTSSGTTTSKGSTCNHQDVVKLAARWHSFDETDILTRSGL
ncbi:MAG: hypothetical protein ACK56F_30380 [bacterium]